MRRPFARLTEGACCGEGARPLLEPTSLDAGPAGDGAVDDTADSTLETGSRLRVELAISVDEGRGVSAASEGAVPPEAASLAATAQEGSGDCDFPFFAPLCAP